MKNQDVSLEKSSSSASSADPLVVAAAQAELDEALINESKAKLELATRLANKAKHKIELVKSKSASKSSTRSRSIHRGPAPAMDGKSYDDMSQITATRDVRDDLSDLIGLDVSGMDKIPEEYPQGTEENDLGNFTQSTLHPQYGPQAPTVTEVPMRIETQTAEVPPTTRLDERALQAFTREQEARLEQQRMLLDEEAQLNAQHLREVVLQQEARVQQLAGAQIAQQREISAHEVRESINFVEKVAEQRLREERSKMIETETAAKQRIETVVQERDAARQSETRSLIDATRNELFHIAQSEDDERRAAISATRDELFLIAQREENERKAKMDREMQIIAEEKQRVQQAQAQLELQRQQLRKEAEEAVARERAEMTRRAEAEIAHIEREKAEIVANATREIENLRAYNLQHAPQTADDQTVHKLRLSFENLSLIHI